MRIPASAQFPDYNSGYVKWIKDSTYVVNSYVDAENSYGALLRSKYRIKLKIMGDDQWKCLKLKIDDDE